MLKSASIDQDTVMRHVAHAPLAVARAQLDFRERHNVGDSVLNEI